MMLTFLEYAWSIFFITLLSCCALVAAWVPVTFIFRLIQLWKPDFGRPYVPPEPPSLTKVSKRETHLTALDFLLRESMRRRRVNMKKEHEIWTQPMTSPQVDFSLEELRAALVQPPQKLPAGNCTDLWCVVNYPHGPGTPYFLISKLSQRGRGLRTSFSPSPKGRWTADKDSAARLAKHLGQGFYWCPANASARQLLRDVMKHQTEEDSQNVAQMA